MHICMLSDEFPPYSGGEGIYVYNLSKKLIENGHDITIITRGTWKKSYYENIDGIPVYRVRFIPSYPSIFKLHGFFVNKLFKSLESDFDLLHIHGSIVPVIHTSLPTIVTMHGTTKKDIDNMRVMSLHFFVVKTLRKQLIDAERNILKNADVVTAVSESCAEELRKFYAIKKKVVVVKNGVDSKFFIPIKNKSIDNYILYTGRLETRKGLTDLIESAEYICKEYQNIKFILTGKGTIKRYLERKVNKLGLEKNFCFVGYIDRNALLEYYQNATIYVLPSYYEGLPTTLLEAMSCGIPPVATNVDGTSEVIVNEKTGLLVPSRNPKKLAEAILRLLSDEELRKEIGINARKHIAINYDWDIITDKVEKVYENLLATKVRWVK